MSSETQFWHWFQQHHDELFHFERDQEPTFDRVNAAIGAVDHDLTFEFGPVRDGKREFVISAAGLKRAFPAVERLYNARPILDRFHVTAFRPRRPVVNNIKYGDLTIKARDVYYHLCRDKDPGKIGVLLFLPGYSEDQESVYRQIGYLFLDDALGEYDVEMKVGFIEMMGHDSRHFEGANLISEMAGHFDQTMRSKSGT